MPHISETAALTPAKAAYIMAGSGQVVSYGELDERANQAAHLFRLHGLKAGDHLAMMLPNCPEFLQIAAAAMRAGLIFTPVSTHLKWREASYILANCGAKLFISHIDFADEVASVCSETPSVETFFMIGGMIDGYSPWEESVDQMPSTPLADQQMGAPMLYSSGTTGQPKGIFVPPYTEQFDAPYSLSPTLAPAFGLGPETTYLSPAPLYHAAPLHYNLVVLDNGGTSVVMERFDPETALKHIEQYRVTHSQWVPIMFVRMLKLPSAVRSQYDLGSHQLAIHAAAPCPVEVKEAMIEWWGPIVVEYYSSSEAVGFTVINSEDWLSHKGSVGKPLFGRPHIVDDSGAELPVGEVGTIYFSELPNQFHYHDEPEKTKEAYNDKGWSTCGDVGYLDEEGYLYLTDRKNFTIISGGVNIYPAEIENLLIGHDKVADVAVFGVPDSEFGEAVQAVIQPQNWADATDETAFELLEWLRDRLSHIKVPKSIDFSEKLPRADNGKLYKKHLMEAYRNRE